MVSSKVPSYYKDEVPEDSNVPTDPYFPLQWYLRNTGQNGGKVRLDLNVQAAWDQGITGKNVTTAIMDDGVDYMHPDLKYNYVSIFGYSLVACTPYRLTQLLNCCNSTHRMPRRVTISVATIHTRIHGTPTIGLIGETRSVKRMRNFNLLISVCVSDFSHGTRCAGEVAAARDNGVCGVGVAYDSKIAGTQTMNL